jgi:hypothetical protein
VKKQILGIPFQAKSSRGGMVKTMDFKGLETINIP